MADHHDAMPSTTERPSSRVRRTPAAERTTTAGSVAGIGAYGCQTVARSRATSIQATPELVNDPEAFDKFQKAQGELTGALSRLMVVAEQYPNLKANQAFQDLRVQLEGTENRITVARNRYIKTVADYNVLARSFPSNLTAMVFGYKVKPSFTVQNEAQISVPPSVSFDKPASK